MLEHAFNHDYYNLPFNIADSDIIDNSDTLLITIGESWTWGDSLEDHGFSRLENVWGKRLANKLSANWLNVAKPGASNFWIVYQLQELLRSIDKFTQFKKLNIVLCLTEFGREFTENWSWVDNDPSKQDLSGNPIDMVKQANLFVINQLIHYVNELEKHFNTRIVITHNFCSKDYWEHNFDTLPLTWNELTALELGVDYQANNACTNVDRIEYLRQRTHNIKECIYLQDQAGYAINFLTNSILNYQRASKHPTPDNHELFAEYIYTQIFA